MQAISSLAALAAILLVIELLGGVAIAGVALYFARRGLIIGQQKLASWVARVTEEVRHIEGATKEASEIIVGTQIQAISTTEGIRRGLRAFLR